MNNNRTLTIARQHVDAISGRIIMHYGCKTIFTVYVKRHNGRKKIVFMGNGDQIKEVLNFYHKYEIFRHDVKYLYHRVDEEPIEMEAQLLRDSGKRTYHLPPNIHSGRKALDFKRADIASIKNVPITLINGTNEFIKRGDIINSQTMNKTRLLCILMAEFLAIPDYKKKDFLSRGDLHLEKHKLMSGGIDADRVDKQNAVEELVHDVDLL